MFEHYDHLGFITPYYYIHDENFLVSSLNLTELLLRSQRPLQIDVRAVIEIISRYHCFADRTLVEGVYRAPWMARPNPDQTGWEYGDLPSHGDLIMPEAEVAAQLFAKLQEEILGYCKGCSTVGLLLSGGMDSRIVAGVLDYLLKTRQFSANVVAITWGMEQTRDVLYARQIAERLGWARIHYPLSAEDLFNNIAETARRGCEYSPVHLHATPRVRDIKGVDCILAASYGDSVGRAEYSGRHVTQLIGFEQHTLNWFKLLRVAAYKEVSADITQDVMRYRMLFPRDKAFQQHEIDQQAHYMRRKLNHCMAVIHEKVPLLQVFSSPDVFGFMWSLSPQVRNDMIYKHLFGLLQTELADIPWARTGAPYLTAGKPMDDYPSLHHQYGRWIRGELFETIKEKVLSTQIDNLGIFNMQALETALEVNRKLTRQVRATKIDEISIWLAAVSDFIAMFDIQGTATDQTLVDMINGMIVSPVEVAGLAVSKFLLSRK